MQMDMEVVIVKLSRSESGVTTIGSTVLIHPEGAHEYDTRMRLCDCDLNLLHHFAPGEMEARFDAVWDGHSWTLCGRRHDTPPRVSERRPPGNEG
jgi:hypothetical protein